MLSHQSRSNAGSTARRHNPTSSSGQKRVMEKTRMILSKLAVDAEPGLTTGQLMLANDDLKPGMYEYSFLVRFD